MSVVDESQAPPRRVLFMRTPDPDDAYERAFREAGYASASVAVLRFEFVNQEALRAHLERPGAYAGMILTSPRAVEALVEAIRWLPSQAARWHVKPLFAVGPATAGALREAGFSPEGEGSGSADLLVDYITRRDFEAPLLFLCGNRRREVLPHGLRAAGVPLEEVCVYETHPRDTLDAAVVGDPAWIAFFSPSGVEAFVRTPGLTPTAARLVAIGPTTADAVARHLRPPDAVADAPTPDALLTAVRHADA